MIIAYIIGVFLNFWLFFKMNKRNIKYLRTPLKYSWLAFFSLPVTFIFLITILFNDPKYTKNIKLTNFRDWFENNN